MSTILLPKTQHLVVFQEVIRSGSIGSAAKELGLTQPAVSKIINDIEDYFGVNSGAEKYRCNINTCRSIVTLPFRIHYP